MSSLSQTVAPTSGLDGFNCPHCGAYSEQRWYPIDTTGSGPSIDRWTTSICTRCRSEAVWLGSQMIYPDASVLPLPNHDMPEDVQKDYGEARSIAARSARGAAALLRLCIQKLCKELGQSGKDLNGDIAALVKAGLNPKVQRSLDVVRVIGNEAVHPGTLDLRDNPTVASQLAALVNIIVDAMITQPKLVDSLYEGLPSKKKDQIARRDAAAVPPAPLHTVTQQNKA